MDDPEGTQLGGRCKGAAPGHDLQNATSQLSFLILCPIFKETRVGGAGALRAGLSYCDGIPSGWVGPEGARQTQRRSRLWASGRNS